jgi:hypothetical protein
MRYLLVIVAAVLLSSTVNAQVSFSIGFNLDRQPAWGPTGYDHVEFYYLPDIDVYYSVPQQMYYYNERGRWIGRSSLPRRYRGHDLYNSYKVVMNERRPYRNNKAHRAQYAEYKGRHDQQPIRDSRDTKYFVNRNHPEHNNWVKQQNQQKRQDQQNRQKQNKGNSRNKGRSNRSGR